MSSTPTTPSLLEYYEAESAKIRDDFEANGNGCAGSRQRSALIDGLVRRLYEQHFGTGLSRSEDFCLVALGGYGRQELFPHSDVDLLFLSGDRRTELSRREAVGAVSRTLWDLRLRVGAAGRALNECGELRRDNLEFSVALLDSRYLAGDQRLFARLRERVILRLVARNGQELIQDLVEVTRRRHGKHGETIFHLEPNVKESPGGLRDYQMARWLALIAGLSQERRWGQPEEFWPVGLAEENRRALAFLSAARSFLHYRRERDDNHLTYELQDAASSLGIGCAPGERLPAEEWMRNYFRHARAIYRLSSQLIEEALPARFSLYSMFQEWKLRGSTANFSVVRGRIYPRQTAAGNNLSLVLGLFEVAARHGLALSREAERWAAHVLATEVEASSGLRVSGMWETFRHILVAPYAASALRAMHRLGLLDALFPEFLAIDSLVVRDFYHRYTVDEHSLMTIQNIHRLHAPESKPPGSARNESTDATQRETGNWKSNFGEILAELEQPELLYLSLLFHDVGKGMAEGEHVRASLEAVERILERLGLEPQDRETVRFLIANHLEMSATLLRRDIFDLETVRAFAEKVGTAERLKMLCLFTYADIKSVNPEALTPWKAEMLWQLYVATANYLSRSVDNERFHLTGTDSVEEEHILKFLRQPASKADLESFLEGFPRRYLRTHSPDRIAEHFYMARELRATWAQVRLRHMNHSYEMTVVTSDRPFLFASLTGTLAAWGMNIVKADAFSNAAGTVLDTFRFVDLHRTLELNPSEVGRLEKAVVDILAGRANLQTLLRGRMSREASPRAKVAIPTRVRFDDESSTHSSLVELVAQDRPGLLYEASSVIAELGLNIEVALIDTEGQKVIDVFYLTSGRAKLRPEEEQALREGLLAKL